MDVVAARKRAAAEHSAGPGPRHHRIHGLRAFEEAVEQRGAAVVVVREKPLQPRLLDGRRRLHGAARGVAPRAQLGVIHLGAAAEDVAEVERAREVAELGDRPARARD